MKIGAILPLSGSAAKYGESMKNAITLATSEINSQNGINGKRLRVIYEDSQADPRVGLSAAQKLISVDKVPAIVGPQGSSVVLSVAPLAERNRVVILSPTGSAPAISDAGDYVFRNSTSDIQEGPIMADFACRFLGLQRIAILYINNDYGVGLRDVFRDHVTKLKVLVVSVQPFEQGATDFRAQLSKIRGTDPDAVYVVGYKEIGYILRQAKEIGIKAQFLSSVMFEDPDVLEIAGDAAEGTYYTYPAYDPEDSNEAVANFVKKYNAEYGSLPDIYAALNYDAIRILAAAMNQGGNSGDGIKEALYEMKRFPGVTGETSFDEKGDVVKPIAIKKVDKGRFVWYKKSYVLK